MRYTDLQKISVVAVSALVVSAILILHPWTWKARGAQASVYVSSDYKIKFDYPTDWKPVADTKGHRFEGIDGFFEVGAAGSSVSIADLAGPLHPQVELPYGSNPVVEDVEIDRERAGLVIPSEDQSSLMRGQSALLVSYPEPIELDGNTYNYFLLWADKDHIREISDTIQFID